MSPQARVSTYRGITLVELSTALALVGLLTAVAVPAYRKVLEDLRVRQASSDMMKIYIEVIHRRGADGQLVDKLDGIQGITFNDPWGRPYVYRSPGTHGDYDLSSLGADGTEGNEDDICSWK